ncbi:MAG: hypothetical protein HY841_03005 [Bacteroidetes bacterium]|nr:hypothetical protein [Bacteroidota bacterium]
MKTAVCPIAEKVRKWEALAAHKTIKAAYLLCGMCLPFCVCRNLLLIICARVCDAEKLCPKSLKGLKKTVILVVGLVSLVVDFASLVIGFVSLVMDFALVVADFVSLVMDFASVVAGFASVVMDFALYYFIKIKVNMPFGSFGVGKSGIYEGFDLVAHCLLSLNQLKLK